jgi:hypothetical protein
MRNRSLHGWCTLAGLVVGVVSLATSARGADEKYRFTIDAGERWVDFQGSRDLYRSQLDYGEGPKLFSGDFLVTAPQGSNRYYDRFQLTLNNWGGEPYTAARLRIEKAKIYELRFDYENVKYFSSIPRFANPQFAQGNLQSRHVFDVGQRNSSLQLRFLPNQTVSPYFAWDRSSRHGPVRTSFAADGDEFILGSNWDTASNDFRAGVNFSLPKFSLLLEQGYLCYREKTQLFASGFQDGASSRLIFGRDIVMSDYNAANDTTADVPFSNAVAVWKPLNSVSLRAHASYSMAGLDPRFSDSFTGVFVSFPLSAFYTGQTDQVLGKVKKPTFFGDFLAEWTPVSRLRITENVKTHNFHVSSAAVSSLAYMHVEPILEVGVIDQLAQVNPLQSFLSFDNLTQELQGAYYVTPRLVARLGHRFERRKVRHEEDQAEYDRNVLIAGLSYDFSARDRISAEYEYGRTDQPIFRTDVVDFQRVRVRGRYSPFEKLQFEGSATVFDNDDDVSSIDFTSRQREYDLHFSYALASRVSVSGGAERSTIVTSILYVLPQTFTTDRSRYREKGNFGDILLNLALIHKASLSLGYSVWGVSGDFPLTYHRPMARLDIPVHERMSVYGQWNFYEYNEKVDLFPQDYRAHLMVVGFRVTVDKP